MKSPVIHIGLHKTATKFFQRDVFPRIPGYHYIERHLYERAVLDPLVLTDQLAFEAKKTAIRERFKQLAGDHQKVIFSDELFSGNCFYRHNNRHSILLKIKELFPDARIILGIRGQFAIVDSLYREYIRQGGVKTFNDFVTDKIPANKSIMGYDPALDLEAFRYGSYLDEIARLFEKQNLFVIVYERIGSEQETLLRDLAEFLHTTPPENVRPSPYGRHKSLANRYLALNRILNRLFHSGCHPSGLLHHRRNPSHLLPKFEFTKVKRGQDNPLFTPDNPPDYNADNTRISADYHLNLEQFPRQYFPES